MLGALGERGLSTYAFAPHQASEQIAFPLLQCFPLVLCNNFILNYFWSMICFFFPSLKDPNLAVYVTDIQSLFFKVN